MTTDDPEQAVELTPSGRVRQKVSGRSEQASFPAFRQATFYGVLGGLCPLIPVPFLDDWVLTRVRRRMVQDLALREGFPVSDAQVDVLAGVGEGRRFPGCFATLGWVFGKVLVKLVRKLFRKVVYVLTMREGLLVATDVFHEGFLLLEAFRLRDEGQDFDAVRTRAAIRDTLAELDLKPTRRTIRRAVRGSRDLLLRGTAVLTRLFRSREESQTKEVVEREEEILGGFVDRLAASLWGDRQHFRRARGSFARHLHEGR